MADTTRLAAALEGRYQIEHELGAGGMATVYVARDLKHQREVALKVLRPELAAVLGAERFLHEIQITARLDHPHILTLIDSGEAGGLLYYVLPLVRGESLRQRLQRERQLGLDEALTITRQIAGALEYAHRHGVVHRDIKPENILLHEGEAMLADFGIALAVREAGGNRLTESGLSLGTPQYMSPEQATGDRDLDARSDIYSLGAVLYEMLAGEPPFTGPTAQAMIAKLMTERPARLRVVRDTVPEGIENAVAKALAKVPADRFGSAADFTRALAELPHRTAVVPARSRSSWVIPAVIISAVAVATLAVMLFRRSPERVILPDRAQLTFTGNARTPALSTDGKRLAYSARQCDSTGHCTTDVVLQDLGGAGSTTLLRGWASVSRLEWAGDGRYLLVRGFEGAGGNWGMFAVPTLGGIPRFMGRGSGSLVGTSDTALVYSPVSDSVAWLRWITLADGVVRDSLSVPHGVAGWLFRAVVLPGGRRILAWRSHRAGWTAVLLDRSGRQVDSLLITDPRAFPIGPSHDGEALLVRLGDPFEREWSAFDLLAYRIRRGDQFALHPDTILSGLQGEAVVAPDGSLLLASGPVRHQVWALERPGPSAMIFRERLLAAWTSMLIGELSPDGNRVILHRRTLVAGESRHQFTLIPFNGGAEQPIDAPPDGIGTNWNGDGSGILLYSFRGRDSIASIEVDLASGRVAPVNVLSWREVSYEPGRLPGGGVLVPLVNPPGIRRVGAPGLADTTFRLPERWVATAGLASSPRGNAVALVGWGLAGDSVLVARLELDTGTLTQLASFYPQDVRPPFWLTDGTLIVQILETDATLVWYQVAAAGGPSRRLGSPPRYPAEYTMSRDGRHVIANTSEDSPDIYAIRNFPRLLEQ